MTVEKMYTVLSYMKRLCSVGKYVSGLNASVKKLPIANLERINANNVSAANDNNVDKNILTSFFVVDLPTLGGRWLFGIVVMVIRMQAPNILYLQLQILYARGLLSNFYSKS